MTRQHRIMAICGLVVLMLLILIRVLVYQQHLDQPLRLHAPYMLEVHSGSNLNRVLKNLEAEAIIPSALDLRLYARLSLEFPQLNAGEYLLNPGITGRQLLTKLAKGEVSYHQVRILEGWTLSQAFAAIASHPALTHSLQGPEQIQSLLGMEVYPEGWLFPDTYNFVRGTTDAELILQAYGQMKKVLAQVWAQRDSGLPYESVGEALIMASIVEKETALASERGQIAGVFIRRLQSKMRLQTDPTVIYGLGDSFNGNLTRRDLQTDTPFNTYTRVGLPPTPIALPGRAAITASVHPDQAQTLYFVATGDGSHYFSTTLEEHNAAVRKYQLGGQ